MAPKTTPQIAQISRIQNPFNLRNLRLIYARPTMYDFQKERALSSLGAIIIDYSPYSRSRLAAQFLLAGSGAAGLWVVMRWIEPSIFVPLLALAAVPLSLYCLAVLFRLLSPGKRISIRERGIVLGTKAFSWSEIESVTYRLNMGSKSETVSRQSHEFEFHLAGQDRVVNLSLEEDFLPSHVDVQEFVGHLRRNVQHIDFLDEPKIRKEQVHKTGAQGDPDRSARLQAAAESAVRKASNERLSRLAIDALKNGERHRKELSKSRRRSSLIAGVVSGVSTFGTIVAVLVAFNGTIAILFQVAADAGFGTFDILDLFDIPAGALRYGILSVVVAAAWWTAVKLESVARSRRKEAREQASVAKALKAPASGSQAENFLALMKSRGPFGLYLRSFSQEYLQYIEKPLPSASEYELPVEYEVVERDFELALAEAVEDMMPVFALANVRDPSVSRKLKLLCVTDQHWLIVACELVKNAHAVIVYLAAVTDSVLTELYVLDRFAFREKTFLIRGRQCDVEGLPAAEKELLTRFRYSVSEKDVVWQQELRQWLHART